MLILKADSYYHQVENPWFVTFETTVHVTSLCEKPHTNMLGNFLAETPSPIFPEV
jgi:hypothetical protein